MAFAVYAKKVLSVSKTLNIAYLQLLFDVNASEASAEATMEKKQKSGEIGPQWEPVAGLTREDITVTDPVTGETRVWHKNVISFRTEDPKLVEALRNDASVTIMKDLPVRGKAETKANPNESI
jgi:hypothetical protein